MRNQELKKKPGMAAASMVVQPIISALLAAGRSLAAEIGGLYDSTPVNLSAISPPVDRAAAGRRIEL
jgi:hypothetical protein